MCKKFLGKTVCLKCCMVCEDKMSFHKTCKEIGMADFHVLCIGGEQCMKMFGEQCKVKCCKVSDCCLKVCIEGEKCGKVEIEAKFTDEGLCRTVCHNGKMHKEMWRRKVCEDGFYKCCKVEGLEEFAKATGMPECYCKAIMDMKVCWKNCGSGFEWTECCGGCKTKTCAKFDEEFCEKGKMGKPDSKCIMTKVGCGKYKCIEKCENGTK